MPATRLGTAGELACLVATLAAAALASGWRAALALALAVALAALFHRGALRVFASRASWLFVALLVLSGGLWLGERDLPLGVLRLSRAGLALGAQMALRALAIFVATSGLSASTSPGELAGLLERAGVKGLGFTAGVAFNLLPVLQRSAQRTWDTLRMRGGLRRRRGRLLRLAALTVMSNALRRADEITVAAEVRGFGPERARPLPLRRGALDLPVTIVLALVVAGLAIWP